MHHRHVIALSGRFRWERWSPGEEDLLAAGTFHNGITIPGINDRLEAAFRSGTQRSLYCGLIGLTSFTGFDEDDTMASHPGWVEVTSYSESTRVQWSPSAAAAGVLVNATLMSFTMTANVILHGIFLASSSTKGESSSVLWSGGAFTADQQMSSAEVLKVEYELTASAGVEG